MSWHERPYAGPGGDGGGWRFADNPLTWAPSIGSVAGIRIRISLLFILYIIFELLSPHYGFAFQSHVLFILFGSVFLHELGHCFAARHVGGSADEVLLWPLGGLAYVDAPRRAWPQFVTVIWGPMVNLILATAAWLLLRFVVPAPVFLRPIALSFAPFGQLVADSENSWVRAWSWLSLIFRMNYYMLLFNLLCPMYPMDSGRILQTALWHKLGEARATLITTTVGMITAICLAMLALTRGGMSMILLSIAIFGYITCLQQRQMVKAGMIGDDDFAGYGALAAKSERGPRREGWLARRKRLRLMSQRENARKQAEQEQIEVDRILAKVHDHGLQSLSRAERRTLETATRRQREEESTIR